MNDNILTRLVEWMPKLKNYSIVLVTFLIEQDPKGEGVSLKHWYIMKKTGLCQRSLQMGIRELENQKLLTRRGRVAPIFILHL